MEAGPTLIVNYIPDAWTEAKLASHFAVYAPVSVKLCRDRATGRSLGYGFIQFGLDSADAAHAAIAEVNGRPAEHKRLKVTLAKPREEVKLNTNVYICGLPPSFTDDDLRDLCAPFGEILEVTVLRGRPGNTKHATLSGFCRYARRAHSDAAIVGLHQRRLSAPGASSGVPGGLVVTLTARYATDSRTREKEAAGTWITRSEKDRGPVPWRRDGHSVHSHSPSNTAVEGDVGLTPPDRSPMAAHTRVAAGPGRVPSGRAASTATGADADVDYLAASMAHLQMGNVPMPGMAGMGMADAAVRWVPYMQGMQGVPQYTPPTYSRGPGPYGGGYGNQREYYGGGRRSGNGSAAHEGDSGDAGSRWAPATAVAWQAHIQGPQAFQDGAAAAASQWRLLPAEAPSNADGASGSGSGTSPAEGSSTGAGNPSPTSGGSGNNSDRADWRQVTSSGATRPAWVPPPIATGTDPLDGSYAAAY